jgi:hypothetical protein
MGNVCMGKKPKISQLNTKTSTNLFSQNDLNKEKQLQTPKNDQVIYKLTSPIETPETSIYMQTLNNLTPKSEFSIKSSKKLKPMKKNFENSIHNDIQQSDLSFADCHLKNDSINSQNNSFRIYGTNNSRKKSDFFTSLRNLDLPELKAVSKDSMLITDGNIEILYDLSNQEISGPIYFNDPQSQKTELKMSSQKYIIKKDAFKKSKKMI